MLSDNVAVDVDVGFFAARIRAALEVRKAKALTRSPASKKPH